MGPIFGIVIVVGVGCGLIGWCIAKYQDSSEVSRRFLEVQRLTMQKSQAETARDAEIQRCRELERVNSRLVSELAGIATRPPTVIDPAPMIRAMGEAIASAYGSPSQDTPTTPDHERTIDFSKVMPAATTTDDTQWFPDVEMDGWLENMEGFPTKGGWVNRSTTSQAPPPDGQLPVHRLLENGNVTRVDGQPMFRAGDGQAATPPGGVE